MHSNQRLDCLLTGGDGASNAVRSMHGNPEWSGAGVEALGECPGEWDGQA